MLSVDTLLFYWLKFSHLNCHKNSCVKFDSLRQKGSLVFPLKGLRSKNVNIY